MVRQSRCEYVTLRQQVRPIDSRQGPQELWGRNAVVHFCNGPLGVNPLSECHVAEVLLLFGVGVTPPHHAIRVDAVSPSKTRVLPREARTALLTASPPPSSRRRDLSGTEFALRFRTVVSCYAVTSRLQRNVLPSTHMR